MLVATCTVRESFMSCKRCHTAHVTRHTSFKCVDASPQFSQTPTLGAQTRGRQSRRVLAQTTHRNGTIR